MGPGRGGSGASRSIAVRVVTGVMLLGLIGAAAGIGLLARDDTDSTSTPTSSTIPLAKLSPKARELLALLQKKDAATYHARYSGSSPDSGGVTLETWQRPPDIRQDTTLRVQKQAVDTRVLVLDGQQVRCVRLASEPDFTCQNGGAGPADPLAGIRSRLGEGTVTSRDTEIGGRTVRCFQFVVDGARNDLCVTPDRGIPVLVRAGGSELRLAALNDAVGPNDFALPAPVTNS